MCFGERTCCVYGPMLDRPWSASRSHSVSRLRRIYSDVGRLASVIGTLRIPQYVELGRARFVELLAQLKLNAQASPDQGPQCTNARACMRVLCVYFVC